MSASIVIVGARQHNLKNISVSLPKNKLTVVTGPSGSGKSSLVFDTLYAEGQRRYVESLSGHARRILTKLPRADVDLIEGLSPALAVREREPSRNPRSTVGTSTEIYDYLRVLFATLGEPHCPTCGARLTASSPAEVVRDAWQLGEGARFSVLAPVLRPEETPPRALVSTLRAKGFVRLRVDDAAVDLESIEVLPKGVAVDVVVDRLSVREGIESRLAEAVDLAYQLAGGIAVLREQDGTRHRYSEGHTCFDGHSSIPSISPQLFSFNAPAGACPTCDGLGRTRRFVEELAVGVPDSSLRRGAVTAWGKPHLAYYRSMLEKLGEAGVDLDTPFDQLPSAQRNIALHGGGGFEGILPGLRRRADDYARRKLAEGADEERVLEFLDEELGKFATMERCPSCDGTRLGSEARSVRVTGRTIAEVSGFDVLTLLAWIDSLEVPNAFEAAIKPVLRSIRDRLRFLRRVGLGYLSLARSSSTLSSGEAQRVHLATQLGARLSGVLYVLDEPTAGLHPADGAQLIETLAGLRDEGNTVIVVEHDEQSMRAADHLVELGPGAGDHGGEVVEDGDLARLCASSSSLTGAYLSGRRTMPVPDGVRAARGGRMNLHVGVLHNLRDVAVELPLGTLCCITGVSGSGKSSLVVDALLPAVRHALGLNAEVPPGVTIDGVRGVSRVSFVDATPIGRSPRSNLATYVGILGPLRELFAGLPEARARGYRPGRFSFNVKGGRCEACKGEGVQRVAMLLLPDAEVVCEVCGGARYNDETLQVRYRGLSIAEALELSVDRAHALFEAVPMIRTRLEALRRVGLGYLSLGRRSTTLSTGEAQRIKLARDLAQPVRKPILYVFDEPTRGLHFVDVEQLIGIFHQLVREGHTVIAVEHQMDLVRNADWIVDLGPGSGPNGGRVVAQGSPDEIMAAGTLTGKQLQLRSG
jgi:excinuclease ABC subunit A